MIIFELIATSLIKDLNDIISSNKKIQLITPKTKMLGEIFKYLSTISNKSELNGLNQKYVSIYLYVTGLNWIY